MALPWSAFAGLGALTQAQLRDPRQNTRPDSGITPAVFQSMSREDRKIAVDTRMSAAELQALDESQYQNAQARYARRGQEQESRSGASVIMDAIAPPAAQFAPQFMPAQQQAYTAASEQGLSTGAQVAIGVAAGAVAVGLLALVFGGRS